MVDKKPLVLVLGATGNTGRSIVDGLLKSGQYVRRIICPVQTIFPKAD